jgi:hypothetical protein
LRVFCFLGNGTMGEVQKNPVIICFIHHHHNPLESVKCCCLNEMVPRLQKPESCSVFISDYLLCPLYLQIAVVPTVYRIKKRKKAAKA